MIGIRVWIVAVSKKPKENFIKMKKHSKLMVVLVIMIAALSAFVFAACGSGGDDPAPTPPGRQPPPPPIDPNMPTDAASQGVYLLCRDQDFVPIVTVYFEAQVRVAQRDGADDQEIIENMRYPLGAILGDGHPILDQSFANADAFLDAVYNALREIGDLLGHAEDMLGAEGIDTSPFTAALIVRGNTISATMGAPANEYAVSGVPGMPFERHTNHYIVDVDRAGLMEWLHGETAQDDEADVSFWVIDGELTLFFRWIDENLSARILFNHAPEFTAVDGIAAPQGLALQDGGARLTLEDFEENLWYRLYIAGPGQDFVLATVLDGYIWSVDDNYSGFSVEAILDQARRLQGITFRAGAYRLRVRAENNDIDRDNETYYAFSGWSNVVTLNITSFSFQQESAPSNFNMQETSVHWNASNRTRVYIRRAGTNNFAVVPQAWNNGVSFADLDLRQGANMLRVITRGDRLFFDNGAVIITLDSAPAEYAINVSSIQNMPQPAPSNLRVVDESSLRWDSDHNTPHIVEIRRAGTNNFVTVSTWSWESLSLQQLDLRQGVNTVRVTGRGGQVFFDEGVLYRMTDSASVSLDITVNSIAQQQLAPPANFRVELDGVWWDVPDMAGARVYVQRAGSSQWAQTWTSWGNVGISFNTLNMPAGTNRIRVIAQGGGMSFAGGVLTRWTDSAPAEFAVTVVQGGTVQLEAPEWFSVESWWGHNDVFSWDGHWMGSVAGFRVYVHDGTDYQFVRETVRGDNWIFTSDLNLQEGNNRVAVVAMGGGTAFSSTGGNTVTRHPTTDSERGYATIRVEGWEVNVIMQTPTPELWAWWGGVEWDFWEDGEIHIYVSGPIGTEFVWVNTVQWESHVSFEELLSWYSSQDLGVYEVKVRVQQWPWQQGVIFEMSEFSNTVSFEVTDSGIFEV